MADPFTWAAAATLGGAALGATGTIMGANNAASGAYANEQYATLNAQNTIRRGQYAQQQLQQQANEARAVGTREAALANQKTKYIVGAGRAAAAAGGGNATDTGVATQLGDVQRQGDYEKLMSLYTGENKARGLEYAGQNAAIDAMNQAQADIYGAKSASYRARQGQRQSLLSAGGTILGAAGSLGTQYATRGRNPYAQSGWEW